jgi:predicted nucleotidyltransferase
MSMELIKEKIKKGEYDFLKSDPHLGDNILLLTAAGSIAYGTNVAGSDIDLRGIALERKEDVLGLSRFEQFEDQATDTVIYGLRKFVNLCLNCNPNVLEMLGTREEHLLIISDEGRMLRDNSGIFLSKRAIHSFGNYATAQLRRLQNALARDSYPRPQKEQHILNSIYGQIEHLKRTYKSFTGNNINLYIDISEKKDMETEIFIDINLRHYPLRDFKNIYSDMNNVIIGYDKLNHRNSKKDELHLNKHAMHLIRLLVTGTEILEGKGIHTRLENEKELFLDIRSGKFTYDEIFEMARDYEKRFKLAAQQTSLPEAPDYKRVEELMLGIYQKHAAFFGSN